MWTHRFGFVFALLFSLSSFAVHPFLDAVKRRDKQELLQVAQMQDLSINYEEDGENALDLALRHFGHSDDFVWALRHLGLREAALRTEPNVINIADIRGGDEGDPTVQNLLAGLRGRAVIAGVLGGSGGPAIVHMGRDTDAIGATGRISREQANMDSRGVASVTGMSSMQKLAELAKQTEGNLRIIGMQNCDLSSLGQIKELHVTGLDMTRGRNNRQPEPTEANQGSSPRPLRIEQNLLKEAKQKLQAAGERFLNSPIGRDYQARVERYERTLASGGHLSPSSYDNLRIIVEELNHEWF